MEGNTEFQKRELKLPEADFRQRVEDKFNWAFGEVFQENKPRISVDIFFSCDKTPEDLEGLYERIREADIYIPEAFGWERRHLDLFRKASFGEIDSAQLTKRLKRYSPVFRKQVQDVYNSHKPITIIDVPSWHRLKNESNEVWTHSPSYEGNFYQVLDYTRAVLANLSYYHNDREEYMLRQVTPKKIEELLKIYPSPVIQQTINILLSLGSGHVPMPLDYSEYSFTDEGIIRSKFGKEVDDELAARIFLESFLEDMISSSGYIRLTDWLTKYSKKISMLKRRIVGELTFEEAQKIFDYRKSYQGIFPRQEFNRIFFEKRISIPRNEKELDEFLAKPLPRPDRIQE